MSMLFNEDSRVKIPSILHLIQLGYSYLSLKNATWDQSTNIFTEVFFNWLLPMLMNGQVRVAHPGEDQDLNEAYKEVDETLGMVAEKGDTYGK